MRVIERARVTAVEGGRARLVIAQPDDASNCARCPAADACGPKAGPRELTALAPSSTSPGDEVSVAIEGPGPVWAALVLLVLPLASAFAAGLLTYGFTSSEGLSLAAGAAGGGAAYLATYLAGAGSTVRVEILSDGSDEVRTTDDEREPQMNADERR